MRDDTFEAVAKRMDAEARARAQSGGPISQLAERVWRAGSSMTIRELSRVYGVTPDEIRAAYNEAFEVGREERQAAYDAARKSGWSDRDVRRMIDLSNDGYSCKQISELLGINESAVKDKRRSLIESGEITPIVKRFRWTKESTDEAIRMHKAGKSHMEIAQAIGSTAGDVHKKLQRLMWEGKINGVKNSGAWKPDELAVLVSVYRSGEPYAKVAEATGRSEKQAVEKISRMVRLGEIERRERGKRK